MATQKPDLTRVWADSAPPGNVVDPDTTTPGKVAAGWQAEVPPFEHFNFLQKWFTQGLAHFNEQGIAVWDTDTVYPTNGLAKGSNGKVYIARVEQSGNNPVTDDGTNWVAFLSIGEFSTYSDFQSGIQSDGLNVDMSKLKLAVTLGHSTPGVGNSIYIKDGTSGTPSSGNEGKYFDVNGDGWLLIPEAGVTLASQFGLPSGGDDTSKIAELDTFADRYRLQAGTYNIDEYIVSGNRIVYTDGIDKTIFQQNSGILTDTRVINLANSDIKFGLEGFTVIGNITTDSGEQKHAVYVRNLSAQIDRVEFGDVKALDIRGDAVYIGGDSSFNPRFIKHGDVYAFNCIRNGVSITGGDRIEGGNVYAPNVGLFAYDIEPDTAGGIVGKVTYGEIYGRQCGILGEPTQGVEKDVQIESIELDGSLSRSVPPLGVFSQDGNGLVGRNTKGVKIERVEIYNQQWEALIAVFSGADVKCDNWRIGELVLNGNNTDLSRVDILNLGGFKFVSMETIENTSTTPGTEVLVTGASSGDLDTRVKIGKVVSDTKLARFCSMECGRSEITFTADQYCLTNMYDGSTFEDAEWDVGRIAGINTGEITFSSSRLRWNGSFKYDSNISTNYHVVEINSKANQVLAGALVWNGVVVDDTAMTQP